MTDEKRIESDRLPPGWHAVVSTEEDTYSTPYEADCYSDADKAAWRNDEWCFVSLVLNIVDTSENIWGDAVIGGVEDGLWDSALDHSDLIEDLLREASAAVEDTIVTALSVAVTALREWKAL